MVAKSIAKTILHLRAQIVGLPLAAPPTVPAGPALAPTASATPTTASPHFSRRREPLPVVGTAQPTRALLQRRQRLQHLQRLRVLRIHLQRRLHQVARAIAHMTATCAKWPLKPTAAISVVRKHATTTTTLFAQTVPAQVSAQVLHLRQLQPHQLRVHQLQARQSQMASTHRHAHQRGMQPSAASVLSLPRNLVNT